MKQQLEKIIQKAINGGWKEAVGFIELENSAADGDPGLGYIHYEVYDTQDLGQRRKELMPINSLEELIFDHDFAKAFWGDSEVCVLGGTKCEDTLHIQESGCGTYDIPSYQYHLQKLAISEDRIGYLMQFVD